MDGEEAAEPAIPHGGRGGTLTVLGCDGSYPGPGGAASGYLLGVGGASIWLDAGSGTFAALQLVTDPGAVDAVVLSHEHPDHWSDVDAFAVWLRQFRPVRPVPVYAPPGLRERTCFGDAPVLAWHEVEPSHRVVVTGRGEPSSGGSGTSGGGALLSFAATDHGPPTLAVRAERIGDRGQAEGPAFGFSADTGPDWSSEELGPLGLLLCEATFTHDHEGESRHLSGRQAGVMASASPVGALVLTHTRPSSDRDAVAAEAAEGFGREIARAAPGRVFTW